MAELSELPVERPAVGQPDVGEPAAGQPATPQHRRAVKIWQLVFAGILLVFVASLGYRLFQTKQSEQRAHGLAPQFTFTTFDGETISLSDLAGKGVVLNFWASWCDPCREEAALLEANWRQEQGNGIVFIGLDYLDQEPAAKAYLEEYGISYPSGPDLRSEAARRYGIKGVPETFFINPAGDITQIVIGPVLNQEQMDQYLAAIRPN